MCSNLTMSLIARARERGDKSVNTEWMIRSGVWLLTLSKRFSSMECWSTTINASSLDPSSNIASSNSFLFSHLGLGPLHAQQLKPRFHETLEWMTRIQGTQHTCQIVHYYFVEILRTELKITHSCFDATMLACVNDWMGQREMFGHILTTEFLTRQCP